MPVSEADVGILRYANQLKGFTGILKHRFDTFRVKHDGSP